jgi:chromate transporter
MCNNPSLVLLFISFLRMGITAFGGPAMIAYIRKMAVNRNQWLDSHSFQNGVALCQSIPGATAMQMAAYVGLKVRGVRGAIASYIGFGLPAFILMTALSFIYARTHEIPAVISVFSGLQAIIVAIVANAVLSFGKTYLKSFNNAIIALVAAALFGFKINPIFILILAALLAMLFNNRQTLNHSFLHSNKMPHTIVPVLLFLLLAAAGFILLFFFHKELFHIALIMSRIDLIAFGGGFASVPLMFHEVVEVRSWIDGLTFLNGIIMGQFTPGPIVITATFVGYMMNGFSGELIATIAILLPSFLILVGIAPLFDMLQASPHIKSAIGGILCSFVGLLLTVTVRFGMNVNWDWPHVAIAAAAFTSLVFKVDVLWVVLAGTAISAFVF